MPHWLNINKKTIILDNGINNLTKAATLAVQELAGYINIIGSNSLDVYFKFN